MKTLNAPVFELSPENDYYKVLKGIHDAQPRVNAIFKATAEKYGYDASELKFYSAHTFGFGRYSKETLNFDGHLKKHANQNGVLVFKRASSIYKKMAADFQEIDAITKDLNPFTLHEIFGFNNLRDMQWLGDRFFVEVKSAEATQLAMQSTNRHYDTEPVLPIAYEAYLELVLRHITQLEPATNTN